MHHIYKSAESNSVITLYDSKQPATKVSLSKNQTDLVVTLYIYSVSEVVSGCLALFAPVILPWL